MKNYAKEARARYGSTYSYGEYEEKTKNYTKEKWAEAIKEFMKTIGGGSMIIEIAQSKDKQKIAKFDIHIPFANLGECIRNGQVYVLKDDSIKNGDQNHRVKDPIVGVLRYSFFWQRLPFLDLLYIDDAYRNCGFGKQMMRKWEETMSTMGYKYVMTSTQADEDAWRFYEKLGYHKVGGFFPPEQKVEEWMYIKEL